MLIVVNSVIALLLTSFLTAVLIKQAPRFKLIDLPNERSAHHLPKPRGGGFAFVAVYAVIFAVLTYMNVFSLDLFLGVLLPGLFIAMIGLLDDMFSLGAKIRFMCQLAAIAVMLFALGGMPSVDLGFVTLDLALLGNILGVMAFVWLINLYNFMDGIDGIAAIEGITVLISACLCIFFVNHSTTYLPMILLFISTLAGFLLWNWSPAKIFMGDVGSNFIGFMLSAFIVLTVKYLGMSYIAWLILLSVFWVDTTYTLFYRIYKRQKWHEAHCSHAYQILARQCNSHKRVALMTFFYNMLWLLPLACLSLMFRQHGLLFLGLAILPVFLLCIYLKAGKICKK